MKNIKLILGILTLLISGGSYGQSNYFYYYNGEKFFLELDTQNMAINTKENTTAFIEPYLSDNASLGTLTEDYTRGSVIAVDELAKMNQNIKTYYFEIQYPQGLETSNYFALLNNFNTINAIVKASPSFKTSDGKKIGLSNNFYVKLRSEADVNLLYDTAKNYNLEILGHDQYMPLWFVVSCARTNDKNALEFANIFQESGLFESTEPAFIYHNLEASADPYFNNQWGLKNTGQYGAAYAGIDIKAEQAWGIATGTGIKTAIYDHGFEMNHPDLAANVFGTGYDAKTGTSPAQVRGPHGTPCAGITGAVQNNNLGISGVAPNTQLVSISINLLSSDTPIELARGFNWARTNGIDVISNSWGGYAPSNIITDAINNALTLGRGGKGCVVVFAAGNENNTNIRYPGNYFPNILVVGAMSPCGQRKSLSSCDGETTWGSCYGSQLDIMAPGVKMPTTDRQGSAGYDVSNYMQAFNGTSSACPVVAGVAALILSKNPNLTAVQVNTIIEQSAQKVRPDLYSYSTIGGRPNGTWHSEMGYGLVNAYQALLITPSPCVTNLTLTTNVTAPATDTRQASSSITASNTIGSGATGIYHAGETVILTNGFTAVNGTVFRSYIEGCSGNYVAKQGDEPVISYETIHNLPEKKAVLSDDKIQIVPNPNNGIFYINIKDMAEGTIQITNLIGATVYSNRFKKESEDLKIDIQDKADGIYIVRIVSGEQTLTTKIIKN